MSDQEHEAEARRRLEAILKKHTRPVRRTVFASKIEPADRRSASKSLLEAFSGRTDTKR